MNIRTAGPARPENRKAAGLIQPPAACENCDGFLGFSAHADELAHPPAVVKLDHAGNFGEQRVVLAPTHVVAGLESSAALPHDDRATGNQLAAEHLDAEALRIGIAPVLGTA